jgi:RNA polymerase sigma-32 factor
LSRYLQEIRKFPMLSPEDELALARRWRETQDMEAAHKLVTSHLRLVAKIAIAYRGYGLPIGDLIGEGSLGMMQAVKRFDPDRGFRLTTYAMWWIRAAIQNHILHNRSLVKMGTTAAQKKLFFNLRRLKGQMGAIDEGDLQPEQVTKIAHTLEVLEQDVVNMNRRLAAPDHSLNAPMRSESEGEWQDRLVDDTESPEITVAESEELSGRKALLANALKVLNERERHILEERRLKDNPATLEDLSRLPEVLRHACAEPMVSGWTHPDRAIRRSVGRSVDACCERLRKRTTRDFIGAFGRLPRSQKASLLPSSPSTRVWSAARSIAGSSAILPNERHPRWLMANDPVVRARRLP